MTSKVHKEHAIASEKIPGTQYYQYGTEVEAIAYFIFTMFMEILFGLSDVGM